MGWYIDMFKQNICDTFSFFCLRPNCSFFVDFWKTKLTKVMISTYFVSRLFFLLFSHLISVTVDWKNTAQKTMINTVHKSKFLLFVWYYSIEICRDNATTWITGLLNKTEKTALVTDTIRYIEKSILKRQYYMIPIISVSPIYHDNFDISTHLQDSNTENVVSLRVRVRIRSLISSQWRASKTRVSQIYGLHGALTWKRWLQLSILWREYLDHIVRQNCTYTCATFKARGIHIPQLRFMQSRIPAAILHCVPKKEATKLWAVTLSNLNRFYKLFNWQTQQEICYAALCRHSTTPNVCCYTTLWTMNYRKINEIYRVSKKPSRHIHH